MEPNGNNEKNSSTCYITSGKRVELDNKTKQKVSAARLLRLSRVGFGVWVEDDDDISIIPDACLFIAKTRNTIHWDLSNPMDPPLPSSIQKTCTCYGSS